MVKGIVPEERYQLHLMLLDVGPMPWRRLLVRPDFTIDELHRLIQLCMGWEESGWHEFWVHGSLWFGRRKGYGGTDPSGTADTPLSQFGLMAGERFRYAYGGWRCQLRLEKIVVTRRPRTFPVCIGGRWNAPPEHCGNGEAYMNHRERIRCPFEVIDGLADLLDEESLDAAQFRARAKKVAEWGRWMYFDRCQLGTSLRSAFLTWDGERVDEEKDGAFSFATGN